MKVLHLGKFYSPVSGGIETHLQNLAEKMAPSVDLSIIVANDRRQTVKESVNGIPVTRIGSFGKFAASSLTWGMSREIAATPADIVHLHAPNPIAMNAFLRSGHTGKLIVTHHADILGRKLLKSAIWPVWKRCMNRAHAVIVGSETTAKFSSEIQEYRDKLKIVPYGMDYSFLDSVSQSAMEDAARFGRYVLAVGRLVPYKGFRFLIKAMRDIDADLVIVGSGPEEAKLRRIADPRVHFVGKVSMDTLAGLYWMAELFALPSCEKKEAFGLVQLEAMYCGLPVVNTALRTGAPGVSLDRQTGYTVPPKDVRLLRSAIESLLSDSFAAATFGANAQHRAKQFTVDAMAAGVIQVYESALRQ